MSAPTSFDLVPTLSRSVTVVTEAAESASTDVDAEGVVVGTDGDVPVVLGVDRDALRRAGFEGRVGQALSLPRSGGQPDYAAALYSRTFFSSTNFISNSIGLR